MQAIEFHIFFNSSPSSTSSLLAVYPTLSNTLHFMSSTNQPPFFPFSLSLSLFFSLCFSLLFSVHFRNCLLACYLAVCLYNTRQFGTDTPLSLYSQMLAGTHSTRKREKITKVGSKTCPCNFIAPAQNLYINQHRSIISSTSSLTSTLTLTPTPTPTPT